MTMLLFLLLALSDLLLVVEFAFLVSLVRKLPRRGRWWTGYYRFRWFIWPEVCHWFTCRQCRIASLRHLFAPKRWVTQHEPLGEGERRGRFIARETEIHAALAAEVTELCGQPQREVMVS